MNMASANVRPRRAMLWRFLAGMPRAAERIIALALSLLLLRTAFIHLGNPYYFLSTVYSYQISGIEVGKWIALVTPYIQIVVAICLLCRFWLREAYGLACVVFLAFLGAQISTLVRGLKISCGCFGATENLPIGRETLLLTGAAAAMAVAGLLCTVIVGSRKPAPAGTPARPDAGTGPAETAKV